jgi:hypothetical protein
VDVEHQPTDLAVGGSNPSRRASKLAAQRPVSGSLVAVGPPGCDQIATTLALTRETTATTCDHHHPLTLHSAGGPGTLGSIDLTYPGGAEPLASRCRVWTGMLRGGGACRMVDRPSRQAAPGQELMLARWSCRRPLRAGRRAVSACPREPDARHPPPWSRDPISSRLPAGTSIRDAQGDAVRATPGARRGHGTLTARKRCLKRCHSCSSPVSLASSGKTTL